MIRNSRGSAFLIVIIPLLLLAGVYFAINFRTMFQTESYQQEVRKKAIAYQEALSTLELQDTLSEITLRETSERTVESPSGEKYTVKLEPLFQDTETVKDVINFQNNLSTNEGQVRVTRNIYDAYGRAFSTPKETLSMYGLKYNTVKDATINSERFSTAYVIRDIDGDRFQATAVDGKPANTANEEFDKVVSTSNSKVKAPKALQLVTWDKSPRVTGKEVEAKTIKIYKDNQHFHNYSLKESDYEKEPNGAVSAIKVIDFSSVLSVVDANSSITYEFVDAKGRVLAYSFGVNKFAMSVDPSKKVDQMASNEQLTVILGDYQSQGSLLSEVSDTESKTATALVRDKQYYNYVEVNNYQELACYGKESYSPIAYFPRANGTYTPNAIQGTTGGIDMTVPTNDGFKRLLSFNGKPSVDPKESSMNYINSPCQNTFRTTAYDGQQMYSKYMSGTESFINGFNTITPINLRMFAGVRAALNYNGNWAVNYTNNKLNVNRNPYDREWDASVGDLYHYKIGDTVTYGTAGSKLYCSDYNYTHNGQRPFPSMFQERTKIWNDAAKGYETYINQQVAAFNTATTNHYNSGGTSATAPNWNNYYKTFAQYMVIAGLVDASGKEQMSIPCISEINRNSTLIAYKPKMNSLSELTFNIVNNVSGPVNIKVTSDIVSNHQALVEGEFCTGINPSNLTDENNRKKVYNCYKEREFVKDWNDEFKKDSAILLVEDDKNTIEVGSAEGEHIKATPLQPMSHKSTTDLNASSTQVVYEYQLDIAGNLDRLNVNDIRTDTVDALPEYNQITFNQVLNNSVPKSIEITSEKLKSAYFKLTIKDKDGIVVKEDYISMEP